MVFSRLRVLGRCRKAFYGGGSRNKDNPTNQEEPAEIVERMEKQGSDDGEFVAETWTQLETLLLFTSSSIIERPAEDGKEKDAAAAASPEVAAAALMREKVSALKIEFKYMTPDQLRGLGQFPNLVRLDLSYVCYHNDKVTTLLIQPHVLPKTITRLNLSGNNLDCDGFAKLLKSGVLSKLTHLDLSDNDLSPRRTSSENNNKGDVMMMTSLLTTKKEGVLLSPELKDLNLRHCQIGDELFAKLCSILIVSNNKRMERLDLEDCNLTKVGMASLSNVHLPDLKYLDLSWNCIKVEGIGFLTTEKKSSFVKTNLTCLVLRHCDIGPKGADYLIQSSSSFQKLERLFLEHNEIRVMSRICALRKAFSHVEKLVVRPNSESYINPYGLNMKDLGMDAEYYECCASYDAETKRLEEALGPVPTPT